MNEEIREILNDKDFNMIKDYIDNLQQENQQLKEDNKILRENYENAIKLLKENKQLKEELEKIKQPAIFIDTQDMEERYGEQLYQDYLEEQNKDLENRIYKAIEILKLCNSQCSKETIEILKGSENNG